MTTEADIHFGPGFGKTNKYSEAKQGNGIITHSFLITRQPVTKQYNQQRVAFIQNTIHSHSQILRQIHM